MARTAGLDAHQHLAGAGLRDRNVLDGKRMSEVGDDGGFHGAPFCGWGYR
ncbi:MAG TPA: hypothetical protein VGR06_04605 [Actinophytocola sp.]|nr:hypothetical protein [Actinophytocola sp.]